jgi:hypothetical protein
MLLGRLSETYVNVGFCPLIQESRADMIKLRALRISYWDSAPSAADAMFE